MFLSQLLMEVANIQVVVHFLVKPQHFLDLGQRDPLPTRLAFSPIRQAAVAMLFPGAPAIAASFGLSLR